MKSVYNRKDWYVTQAEMTVKIHKRLKISKDEEEQCTTCTNCCHSTYTHLDYFDASVMKKYQNPHKIFEIIHCQNDNENNYYLDSNDSCRMFDFDKDRIDIPLSELEVQMSKVGEYSGRGLYTKVDIKKGSTIGVNESIYPVYFNPSTIHLIYLYSNINIGISNGIKIDTNDVINYADGYGWQSCTFGWDSFYVEPNILTYSNHGCNGTYNIDAKYIIHLKSRYSDDQNFTEQNVKQSDFPSNLRPLYSPYYDRHLHHKEVIWNEAVKDIMAGDEILSDYLYFTMYSAEAFYEESKVLKRICNGEEVGLVTKNEHFD
jgi:hypothetical protein